VGGGAGGVVGEGTGATGAVAGSGGDFRGAAVVWLSGPLEEDSVMIRKLAVVFAVLFGIVVAAGWVPQFVTETHTTPDGYERTMWGLFMMSLLDDITHGVSAIGLAVGALHSSRWARIAFTAFGWYYACDALFFLTWGLFNSKPWMADLLLNLPHVIISAIMLWIAYRVPGDDLVPGTSAPLVRPA
jgi:hypothetical protein